MRRVALAAALSGAAVIAPCLAWYVVGQRNVAREAARLESAALEAAQGTADVLAMRVATDLENLREAEASCPFTHYRHLEREGVEDCDCPGLDADAAEAGVDDPLVRARFEIDPWGAVRVGSVTDAEEAARLEAGFGPLAVGLALSLDEPPYLEEVIEPFGELRAGSFGEVEAVGSGMETTATGADTLVAQGPFRWRTVALDGVPTLVAARDVTTGLGSYVQGFVVSAQAIEEALAGAAQPVRLVHGGAGQPGESDVPVPGTAWRLVADATEALADAGRRAEDARLRFLVSFLVGSVGALVAGLCLVGLVWQSERMSRLRARFAAAAAHELRSPLAAIRLHGEMLAENLGKPGLAREYADRVADEAERLGRVVTNVLAYSRLEEGGAVLSPDAGDLGAAVLETVESLRPGLEAAGARLDVEVADSLPAAVFDPDALRHVVQNLVDNAEKFSRTAEDRTIRVRLEDRGSTVAMVIADHGPGVAPAVRARLFRSRARDSRAGADAGLGLGLVLARTLVRAMNGAIVHAETPGGGATFTVTLPADRTLLADTPD